MRCEEKYLNDYIDRKGGLEDIDTKGWIALHWRSFRFLGWHKIGWHGHRHAIILEESKSSYKTAIITVFASCCFYQTSPSACSLHKGMLDRVNAAR